VSVPDLMVMLADSSGYAVAAASGFAARPFLRAVTRVVTLLGALSAILTWLSTHPRIKRIVILLCLAGALLMIVTGCSSIPAAIQTVDNVPVNKASSAAEVGLFGGDYCWRIRSILNVSRHNLSVCTNSKSILLIPNFKEGCVDEKLVNERSRLLFDKCVKQHHGKVLIVNPGFKYNTDY